MVCAENAVKPQPTDKPHDNCSDICVITVNQCTELSKDSSILFLVTNKTKQVTGSVDCSIPVSSCSTGAQVIVCVAVLLQMFEKNWSVDAEII